MAKAKPAKKKTAKKTARDKEVKVDRRTSTKSRRKEADRRQKTVPVDDDRRGGTERRKVARRRQIDPTTCERDYNNDEIEFMHALDAYKRSAGRMFPTCSEILEVLHGLGYRRLTPEELAQLGRETVEPRNEAGADYNPSGDEEELGLDDFEA